ncbi:MAG: hypothetical protein M0Z69_01530 [Actinomycetota bacterium]|nr:hypothetical protein [Actinomycetota bacterium]
MTLKVTQRVAAASASASAAALSMTATVFIRVFGDARRWLSASIAPMPAAIRARRDSASRSTFAEERTQMTR